ncbi:Uu.00g053080.m01.CDS01 [Anthostomella pinea]|uniref:Uu.00g053080.m01.CDS01 n=1 Tax=Anthostomella pinea TaxID=933095 RepID=A0AAI8VWE8_9PEZI|nr:Uu.00g053080.m01.CDS01 [Anthostomella pinea]
MDGPDTQLLVQSNDEVSSQPDEYARENGLSVDSQVDPLSFVLLSHALPHTTPDIRPSNLTSDASLCQLRLPRFHHRNEQLHVSKESLELPNKVIQRNNDAEGAAFKSTQYETRVRISKLKLEPPLLRSDPDYDCRELARAIHHQRYSRIDPATIPSELLDTDLDESLDFPRSAYQFKQQLDITTRDEKLDIPKEALYHLARFLHDDWTEDDQRQILVDAAPRRKVFRMISVTPPLSPPLRDTEFFIPDDTVCQVPLTSDPSSLLSDDCKAAEADLFQEDAAQEGDSTGLEFSTPELPPLGDTPFLSPGRPKLSSIMVEAPLSPLPSSSNMPLNLPELTKSMDMDRILDDTQAERSGSTANQDDDVTFDDDILDKMGDNTASVIRSIEQENLDVADALVRVDIPHMDFSIPEPEWKNLPMNASAHLQCILETFDGLDNVTRWPKNARTEQELPWLPFPSTAGQVSLVESIEDDGSMQYLLHLSDVAEVPTSADYVWKQPGLAILREEEDDEEEFEPAKTPGLEDALTTLVRKRRLEIEISITEMDGTAMEMDSTAMDMIPSSSSLDRGLFSRLEKLYPTAEIIERDFDRFNTLAWNRHSISRSPIISPLAAEADIIVSPATGIILTTILEAIQKPHPGHKGQSAIRERVSSIALRYERLVILVSEGNRFDETARDLTPFETAAYAEFVGFVASLDMSAHVYYIGGGQETLAKWMVSFAARYAPEAAEIRDLMVEDETHWEVFLRRAGMNAYAAQAILGRLKAPDGTPEEDFAAHGLPALLRMTPVERVQRFGRLMGGHRVLNRINKVLETRWG